MRITESKNVTRNVIVAHKCDYCGATDESRFLPVGWHQYSSRHQGWGNDSSESREEYDACSPECYIELIKADLVRLKEYEYDCASIDDFGYHFAQALVLSWESGRES